MKRNFQVGGFFIRSSGVVLLSFVLQLCEQVASVQEGLSPGAQLEGHGYYSGHTVTGRKINYSLAAQYNDCAISDGKLRYMENHNLFDILRCARVTEAEIFVSHLHSFKGPFAAVLGKLYALYRYENFFAGSYSRTVDVLVGSSGTYSAVHTVSKHSMCGVLCLLSTSVSCFLLYSLSLCMLQVFMQLPWLSAMQCGYNSRLLSSCPALFCLLPLGCACMLSGTFSWFETTPV